MYSYHRTLCPFANLVLLSQQYNKQGDLSEHDQMQTVHFKMPICMRSICQADFSHGVLSVITVFVLRLWVKGLPAQYSDRYLMNVGLFSRLSHHLHGARLRGGNNGSISAYPPCMFLRIYLKTTHYMKRLSSMGLSRLQFQVMSWSMLRVMTRTLYALHLSFISYH